MKAALLIALLSGIVAGTLVLQAQTDAPVASGAVERFEVPERDERGQLKWKLAGERAVFRPDGLVDIYNARIEFYSSNRVSLVFTTPVCVLDRGRQRAATDAPVRLERDDLVLTGVGADWSGSNSTITIRSNVHMTITGASLLAPPESSP